MSTGYSYRKKCSSLSLSPYRKVNSKWFLDPNVKGKTINFQKTLQRKSSWLQGSESFLNRPQKVLIINEKLINWTITTNEFLSIKRYLDKSEKANHRVKKYATNMKNSYKN